jgi:hypothetical protein
MKKTILLLFFLTAISFYSQGNSMYHRIIGKIEQKGSVRWNVSKQQLKVFLEELLIKSGSNGIIDENSITIYFVNEYNSYFIYGKGYHVETNFTRTIRAELEITGGQNLKYKSGGTVETCTGNPCEYCDFAQNGGCICKRTKESSTGVNGTCNHTKTKVDSPTGEN